VKQNIIKIVNCAVLCIIFGNLKISWKKALKQKAEKVTEPFGLKMVTTF
jgi:hypothetical protein